MLLHHTPPEGDYLELAGFLQDLENRRLQYESSTTARSYTTLHRPTASTNKTYAAIVQPVKEDTNLSGHPLSPNSDKPTVTGPDLMDLSTGRRPTRRVWSPSRRETGACYRCGSLEHHIRDCPKPDNRPQMRIMSPNSPRPKSPLRSPPRGCALGSRSPSPTLSTSVKGVSLA
jgi:hypothetical protein